MEIIKIHYKISKPVVSFKEIKAEAEAMRRFIVLGNFKGYYNKAFAVSHCQVSERPYSFFVLSPEVVKEKMFEDDVIINPEIIEARLHKNVEASPDELKARGLDPEKIKAKNVKITLPNGIEYQEPCMSFPFRQPKRITRYDTIRVRYQLPGFFGLKTVERELNGIASEIFQHEFDHSQGKNIYFESETPVKWWDLIGTPQSKGGTSLDNADDLNLKRNATKVVDANMAKENYVGQNTTPKSN